MEPDKLVTLIQQAIREGITSSLWILILGALLAASIGALFGSYFKKKGEDIATNEQFKNTLRQAFEQTTIVEQVKANISKASQESLESFKGSLSRELEMLKAGMQDELKRNSDIFSFRYSKIYAAIEDILKLAPIKLPSSGSFDFHSEEVRQETNQRLFNESISVLGDRFNEVESIYNRVAPLVDLDLKKQIEEIVREENRQTRIIIAHIHGGEALGDVDVRTISSVRLNAITTIPEIFAKQLERLTWVKDRQTEPTEQSTTPTDIPRAL